MSENGAFTRGGEALPSFFYDFNRPPRGPQGTYRVYPREWSLWPLKAGDRIVFGCKSDEVEAYGRIVSVENDRLTVAFEEWLS